MARRSADSWTSGKSGLIDMRTGEAASAPTIPVICERIRYYRKQRNLMQKELGARIGVSGNAVTNWEAGRTRPDIFLIPAICDALGISFAELFGMDAPNLEMTEREKRLVRQYRLLDQEHMYTVDSLMQTLLTVQEARKETRKIVQLPLYGKSLAAGFGDPSEFESDSEPIRLYASPAVLQADCVFKVNGDSMEPQYHSGDLVLVKRIPDGSPLQFGEVGAFIVGNELYIKEYREDGLHSLNPQYPVMRFDGDTNVYLVGRVLGVAEPGAVSEDDPLLWKK